MKLSGLHFSKYHGTGNDFIILNGNETQAENLSPEIINSMCDRHFGIGADGLIIVSPSDEADFEMKYYNSDGYPGSMCGNGGRCAVTFALHHNMLQNKSSATFIAYGSVYRFRISELTQFSCIIELKMQDAALPVYGIENGYFIDTGSPHLVLLHEDVSHLDVFSLGRKLRYSKNLMPGGANINFIAPYGEGIFVRTYERGVENETLSCGTGVTASAVVWAYLNKNIGHCNVETTTKGGVLDVGFNITSDSVSRITLKGPAVRVFDGFFPEVIPHIKTF
jgi:diaminopimelate epimerase